MATPRPGCTSSCLSMPPPHPPRTNERCSLYLEWKKSSLDGQSLIEGGGIEVHRGALLFALRPASTDVGDVIHQQEMAVYHHALDGLRDINSFRLIGDAAEKGPVLAFNLEGAHAHDVAQILDKYGIAIRAGQHCTQPLMHSRNIHSTARASFGIYNTLGEAERLIEGVKKASLFLS